MLKNNSILVSVFLLMVATTIVWAGAGTTFNDSTTGMQFIFVQGGCFQMGDNFGDGFSEEKPVHEVCVSRFLYWEI